jgi:electron transport complex protein RnfE
MGACTIAVLVISNIVISLVRKIIPDEVRLPAFIVIVASFVTVVELIMKAYFVELNASLGVYIPLIVVNCIILGRAEAYASKNPPLLSAMDGIGMGLGFTFGLVCIAFFRELFGNGTLCGVQIMPESFQPVALLIKAPGAFLVLGFIVMVMNALHIKTEANRRVESAGCEAGCAACGVSDKENCEKKEAKA